jgi:hypothetical protein
VERVLLYVTGEYFLSPRSLVRSAVHKLIQINGDPEPYSASLPVPWRRGKPWMLAKTNCKIDVVFIALIKVD